MPYFRAGARASLGTRAAVSYHTEEFSFDGMRNMKSLIAAAGVMSVLGVAIGCGGDDHPKNSAEGARSSTGGFPAKGGTGGTKSGDDAGGAGGAENSAGELRISITAPVAASDPNEDEVIVDDDVTVKCLARSSENGDAVKPSSVKIAVVGANGLPFEGADKEPLEVAAAATGQTDEYEGKLSLVAVPSGPVTFRCTAASMDDSVTGSGTLGSLLDHGPTIVEKLPEENSAHPLLGALEVEFTVTPTLLTDDDNEAGLASVKLVVAGVEIKDGLVKDPQSPGTYRATVDFQDPFLFDEPPTEHTSVRIEAINQRTANAATAVRDYPFIVDGKPPLITIEEPIQNAPVKGETVVSFTAVDTGAGIDEDKLEIILSGGDPIKYDATDDSRWNRDGDTFSFRFDTAEVGDASAQITVDINATDNAGNLVNGDSLFLWLDDVPPVVDLDPGNWRFLVANTAECSGSFDPLGAALNDGDLLDAFAKVRALVYDKTKNTGQKVEYPALADKESAKLYLQTDTAQPFLIDTNADDVCDALAQTDFPFKVLSPVKIAGAPLNSKTDSATPPAISAAMCAVEEPVDPIPESLCEGVSDMHVVVQHDVRGVNEEVVYGMGGLTGQECTGSSWDPIAVKTSVEGWLCYAAVASDKLGNSGMSQPLRICYDNPNVPGSPACATGSTTPPTCTDGCTVPKLDAHLYTVK
jgi:hypothetical protein